MFCDNNAAFRVLASNFFYLLLTSSIFFLKKNIRSFRSATKKRAALERATLILNIIPLPMILIILRSLVFSILQLHILHTH